MIEIISTVVNNSHHLNDKYKPYLKGLFIPNDYNSKNLDDWTYDIVHKDLVNLKNISLAKNLKILILYGSLRQHSYSRLLSYEAARIFHHLGADVKIYNPSQLPLKDDASDSHFKVQELKSLIEWSDANFWCSPENHGCMSGVMKTQLDHLPVFSTQSKVLSVNQVNGGSQSFNTVNNLRVLGRWLRMYTIQNQSSIPNVWKFFNSSGRFLPSPYRDRLVDVCEELIKLSCLLSDHHDFLSNSYTRRKSIKH